MIGIGNRYGNAKLSAYQVIYHMISNTAYTNSTIEGQIKNETKKNW